ncbi:serine/threonine-protein kinase [Nocardia aurantiaca]|uniref:non-specific serine/threonine protein kinase n=1 Tax=Nocardia aurantiaca TaxID=2675850 RepID=A0A6I3L1V8_9NOCA|nr:serine/threonine-protein kinase [Nocardia aurantiaca]MTE15258.1 protein kinase [Nocardia aurantiaca]
MAEQLRPGVVFAGYRVERLLGAGGMGEVYLAHDRDLPRFVALKLLNRVASDDDETRQRFLREANIIARLSHPNIVTIYARGEEQGRLWLAMAYVDGSDLAAELLEGPLDPERAAAITADLARALDYAHDAGVLHRDVKPANILLTAQPREWALLTDFGIAESRHEVRGITENGEVVASFQYTAPERFHGEARVDRRADIYSLGCTLFEMLTGAPPFADSDLPRLIYRHVRAPVPSVREGNPALPAALDPVLAKAMAKNPRARFATCTELSVAVSEAIAASRPRTPAPPPRETHGHKTISPSRHQATPPSRPWTRSRSMLVLLAVALLAGAAAAAVGILTTLTDSGPHGTAATSSSAAVPSRRSASATPTTISASAGAGLAADGCQSRRTPDGVTGTDPGGIASGPDAILAFEYAYYVLRSGIVAREFVAGDAANVADSAKIQSGIDSLPIGTRYCVQVSRIAAADDDHWAVKVAQQRPGELQDVFTQTVTTRTVGSRTLITSIVEE